MEKINEKMSFELPVMCLFLPNFLPIGSVGPSRVLCIREKNGKLDPDCCCLSIIDCAVNTVREKYPSCGPRLALFPQMVNGAGARREGRASQLGNECKKKCRVNCASHKRIKKL